MIDQAARFIAARQAGETFEAAIARANDWLASVLHSGGGERLVLDWGKEFDGLGASPPVAIKIVGPPAHFREVTTLERWLRAPLPPSYRRFLMTVGQVAFLHHPARPTYPVQAIQSATEVYREMMDEWFEGYEDEIFRHDWGAASRGRIGYLSWREWPNGSGTFSPEEVDGRNFVAICAGYGEDAHLAALHFADGSGEAPIFQNYADDGAAFFLRGSSFDAWMSSMVDELITAAAPPSGAPSGTRRSEHT